MKALKKNILEICASPEIINATNIVLSGGKSIFKSRYDIGRVNINNPR